MAEIAPISEGKIDGTPALIDFDTRRYAALPSGYVLTWMGNQIVGARVKTSRGVIELKWRPFPLEARIETPVPPE